MTLLTFTIPGKPQGAQRHRTKRIGSYIRMHPTHAHEAAETRIRDIAAIANRSVGWKRDMPVRLVIETFHRRPERMAKARKWWGTAQAPYVGKPDADNIAKLVMDACTKAPLWTDDTVVAELVVVRRWVEVGADGVQGEERTVVRVEGV